jgi:hypothetical protein
VCVTQQTSFAKPLSMVESISCYSRHPPQSPTWLMMEEDQHEQLQRRRRDSLSLSLFTCGSETPCLARLMIDSLETPLYTIGIFSLTQLNVSLEGHHTFSLYLHVLSFFQNPNVFFGFKVTICFLKFPIVLSPHHCYVDIKFSYSYTIVP